MTVGTDGVLPEFERYVSVRVVGAPAFSPTGDVFAYLANTTGLPALWLQPAGGGFPTQLTALSDRRVTDFRWAPDGRRLALLADRHGDEMHQVLVLEPGGWPRQLTDDPRVQFSFGGWAPDSRRLAISGNDREPTEQDAMVLDVETGEVVRALTGGQYYARAFSPDGRLLAVSEFLKNTHHRVWIADLATGESRALDDRSVEAKRYVVGWDAAGAGLYVLTDEGSEFTYLAHLPLAGGPPRPVLRLEAGVTLAELDHGRHHLLAVLNNGGSFALRLLELSAGGEREVGSVDLPLGEPGGASLAQDGRTALLEYATPRAAGNLLEVDLASGGTRPLEQSMLGGLDPETMIEPEKVAYPSFDRDVPAWLYRPRGEGPFPVVLSIHGGPEGQELAGYAYLGLYQYLLSRGIGVLAPNIRGSSGYGRSYQTLIYRDWGGGELRDIEAAADYLATLDWVDASRLAVFGGSFGGFATLSALTRLPDRWAAGVDVVGPSNLLTFVESVPPFWRGLMKEWVGDAEEDREMLVERSPITYVDQLRAPLLVIQGANDPRVVKAESDQMVEKLRERGVSVEYYVDEEAGHGPPGRDGWIEWLRLTAEFLERHLLQGGKGAA